MTNQLTNGEKHSCVSGCHGTVENCKLCHKDRCHNSVCVNSKESSEIREMFNWLFEKSDTLTDRADVRNLMADWWLSKISTAVEARDREIENFISDQQRKGGVLGCTVLHNEWNYALSSISEFIKLK